MNEVFLGLGGNIGQRQLVLQSAVMAIGEALGEVRAQSSLYETQAWGSASTKLYLNQVIKIHTVLSAERLLEGISRIESTFGRIRGKDQNADRILDIDILLYNQSQIDSDNLKVPHPRMHLRKFVLIPICEIDGGLIHPVLGKSMLSLLASCDDGLMVKKYTESSVF